MFAKRDCCWCGCLFLRSGSALQTPNSNSCWWSVNREERVELILASSADKTMSKKEQCSRRRQQLVQNCEARHGGWPLYELRVYGCSVKEQVASGHQKFLKVCGVLSPGKWLMAILRVIKKKVLCGFSLEKFRRVKHRRRDSRQNPIK